jgi:hypothetical protein
MNHTPKPLAVFYMGTTEDVPNGRGKIGSVVFAATVRDPPQMAVMTEQADDGVDVTSACPGAPKKAPRAHQLDTIARNLSPELAMCAAMVKDPAQTAALVQFAEGKMSYAEMRARCG